MDVEPYVEGGHTVANGWRREDPEVGISIRDFNGEVVARIVTTDDLAVPRVFVLHQGTVASLNIGGRPTFHGVFATRGDAIMACPDSALLWVPLAQYPHDVWMLPPTQWFVRRYELGKAYFL